MRDLLLGGSPIDLDLVVEGDAIALASALGGAARVHDRFGTSTVTLDGFSYDIARARTESATCDPARSPTSSPAALARRSEATRLHGQRDRTRARRPATGALTAVPHALDDLKARLLRVLHDRSFIDDPTRLLRLARYASRLRFAIEPHTLALVREPRSAPRRSTP